MRWVTEAARLVGAHALHVSTDYVFDGTKPEPYHEWDDPNPQSVYGRSKLGGEREVDPSHTIVRTAWVCGAHGPNMVKTVLALRDQPELAFVDDQRGCPSFTADLAPAVRRLAVARTPGTFHVTNQGATTWYGFVREILEAGRRRSRQGAPDHHRRARSAAGRAPAGQLRARQRRAAACGLPAASRTTVSRSTASLQELRS